MQVLNLSRIFQIEQKPRSQIQFVIVILLDPNDKNKIHIVVAVNKAFRLIKHLLAVGSRHSLAQIGHRRRDTRYGIWQICRIVRLCRRCGLICFASSVRAVWFWRKLLVYARPVAVIERGRTVSAIRRISAQSVTSHISHPLTSLLIFRKYQ